MQLYLRDQLVENKIGQELQRYATGDAAERYIHNKLRLQSDDLQLIDWVALRKSQSLISHDRQATRSKFVYRWASTASRKNTLYYESDKCEQCGQVEDHAHVLNCRWPLTIEHRETELQSLEENLTALSTHPDLITIIVSGARSVGSPVLLDVSDHPEGQVLRCLLNEQNKIGWYFFFMGFWTRQWAEMQGSYLRNLNKPIRIEGWIGRAQLAVWEFTHSLWVYRNKVLHGGTKEEQMKIESQKI